MNARSGAWTICLLLALAACTPKPSTSAAIDAAGKAYDYRMLNDWALRSMAVVVPAHPTSGFCESLSEMASAANDLGDIHDDDEYWYAARIYDRFEAKHSVCQARIDAAENP
jgi:hypothetical protein